MSPEPAAIDGAAVARSWVEHLRAGGTTPWVRWARRAGVGADTPPGGRRAGGKKGSGTRVPGADLPGAAQLELLRRLNEHGPLPHRVDHVLGRPGPGRGPVHLRLPLQPLKQPAPRKEVLRVAAGVLADLTAQLPPPPPVRRRDRVRRPRPVEGLPAFRLEGPPITVAEVRARLAAAGILEHQPPSSWLRSRPDPGPDTVVVLAAPLDESLRQAWASRVQSGASRAWARFVAQWAGREALPPSAAVHRTVDYWAGRLGPAAVQLVAVTEPTSTDELAGRVAAVLGGSLQNSVPASRPIVAEDPVRLAPAVVDVLRRVNVVLPFVCAEADRPARRTALVALMREVDARREPADLPKRQRGWVEGTAGHIVDALEESGCRCHDELDVLRGIGPATDRRLGGPEVLDAMVRMIHRVDVELTESGRSRGGRR